jgi:hypothetical protein
MNPFCVKSSPTDFPIPEEPPVIKTTLLLIERLKN